MRVAMTAVGRQALRLEQPLDRWRSKYKDSDNERQTRLTHLPSTRPIYGNRRERSVRDVRSYGQAQETAISDAGHGAKRNLDGCIDAVKA